MEKSSARLKVFAILVLVMFAALSTRLWFLQVLATQVYAEEAQNNGVRSVAIDALRGEIWTEDQYGKPNGKPLVQNRSSLEVRVDKQELEESGVAEQVLGELSAMLDIPVKQIRRDLESKLYFDYQPKPVAEFVDEEVAFAIRERQEDFPGVQVRNASVREYPMGTTASHMVGWVGQVTGCPTRAVTSSRSCDGTRAPARAATGRTTWPARSGLEVAVRAMAARWEGPPALRRELRRGAHPRSRRPCSPPPAATSCSRSTASGSGRPRTTSERASSARGRSSTRTAAATSRPMRASWSCSTSRPAG